MSADRTRLRRCVAGALLLAGAVLLALDFLRAWEAGNGSTYLAFDTYQYIYRNMLYAVRATAAGGRGLFWNSLQHCGQPFFSVASTATLYPPHWLFLWLDADLALRAVIVLHLVIAAVGAFALCRELGASPVAAAAGAVVFELGNATLNVTSWMTIVAAPFVWMPVVMLYCERILRAPSLAAAICLGLTLAIALLAGFPQTILFTGQLIALRAVWEIVSRRVKRPLLVLSLLAVGLLLALLLDAVQLLPAIETAQGGLRGATLPMDDMAPDRYTLKASQFWKILASRGQINSPLILIPVMIAGASVIARRTRRIALFYAVVGLVYFALSFGEATPVFEVYRRLPLASLFRAPARFLWVTGFCLAVLTSFGVDALARRAPGGSGRPTAFAAVAAAAATFAFLWFVSSPGLLALEWMLAVTVIGAGMLAALVPGTGRWAALLLTAALCVNLAWFRTPGGPQDDLLGPVRSIMLPNLLPDGDVLRAEARTFAALRERVTPQDRLYLVYRSQSPSFAAKTGALFDLPAVLDYDPQPSRRVAEYEVMMRLGRAMTALDEYYIVFGGTLPASFRRRLLDLAAGRYLVAEPKSESALAVLEPPPRRIRVEGGLSVYENPLALPRAFYVPRLEVVGDAATLLRRLAEGDDDLGRVAMVEEVPSSGFTGVAGNEAAGEVEFVRNDPEHLVLRVRAPERGFVHLADQYAEGWRATVDGEDVPIVRANYLFRAVEVPAGESTIEMRYTAPGLYRGVAVSLATVAALLAYAVYARRARRGSDDEQRS